MLRKQAKQADMEAELSKHAELIGKWSSFGSVERVIASGYGSNSAHGDVTSSVEDPLPRGSHTMESPNGSLQVKLYREFVDTDVVDDHHRASGVPYYADNAIIACWLTLPENEGLTKTKA